MTNIYLKSANKMVKNMKKNTTVIEYTKSEKNMMIIIIIIIDFLEKYKNYEKFLKIAKLRVFCQSDCPPLMGTRTNDDDTDALHEFLIIIIIIICLFMEYLCFYLQFILIFF